MLNKNESQTHKINTDVETASKILESSVDKYGELSIKCAPLYIKYGKTLLKSAQNENQIFGINLKQNPQNLVSKATKMIENSQDDLSLAFEVFETARIIYEKYENEFLDKEKNEKEILKNKILIHQKIGEIFMENDDFKSANVEYKKVIELQKNFLEENDSELAKSQINLAICCLLDQNEFDAMKHYNEALKILTANVNMFYKQMINNEDVKLINFMDLECDDSHELILDLKRKNVSHEKINKFEMDLKICLDLKERISELEKSISKKTPKEKDKNGFISENGKENEKIHQISVKRKLSDVDGKEHETGNKVKKS